MRFAKFVAIILLSSTAALAQLTQVSGTIKDPTGLPYSLGTITATLVISGSPRFTFNSLPYTPPSQPVGLDANGSFVMSLADVTQLTPSGGTWSFHVCSATGTVQPGSPITAGPVCFDAPGFIISGTSVNISTQLSSASARLTTGGTGGGSTVANGTTGQFLIYTSPNTAGGTPTLTTNGTTITTTVPIGCVVVNPCLTSTAVPTSGIGFGTGAIAGLPLVYGTGTSAGQLLALRVNGTNVTSFNNVPAANFNLTTPAAPTNGINVSWQTAAGNPASISAALVGDGTTNFLNGQGVYTNSIPALNLTSTGTALSVAGSISSTTAGSTVTSSAGQTAIGFQTSTGASPALVVSYNGGAAKVIPTITIQGSQVPVLSQAGNSLNFNVNSPPAPTNGKNVAFQVSGTQITAALVGDGSTNCLSGQGTYIPCAPLQCFITNLTFSSGTQTPICTINVPATATTYTYYCNLVVAAITTPATFTLAFQSSATPTAQEAVWASGIATGNNTIIGSGAAFFANNLVTTIASFPLTAVTNAALMQVNGQILQPATAGTITLLASLSASSVSISGSCTLQ